MKLVLPMLSFLTACYTASAQNPQATGPIDRAEMLDASTLDVRVIEDWHSVDGPVPTRQKMINIRVGEVWDGQDYRIPVRMVVPVGKEAKGFHLTGSHELRGFQGDKPVKEVDQLLIEGGVGLVEGARTIDFFSNHRKTNSYRGVDYPTYISSPYTRVRL